MVKIKNFVKIKGSVRKQLFSNEGILLLDQIDHNLVVTSGLAFIATWLSATSQPGEFMSFIGLGTGSTSPTLGDVSLQSPLPTYVQGVLSSPSSGVWQNVTTFSPGVDTGTITEAGIFSTSGGGTMFARQVFAPITKAIGNTLVVTWQISFIS